MATQYVTQSNQQPGIIHRQVVSLIDSAATKGYNVDLPPGAYEISLTINSSLTGTTTTLGTIRPFANKEQTRVTNTDISLVRPSDSTLTIKSLTFPAAGNGKLAHLVGDANFSPIRALVIPHGFRFVVTKGGASTGEQFEVLVVAAKRN